MYKQPALKISEDYREQATAIRLMSRFSSAENVDKDFFLNFDEDGLSLHADGYVLRGDFSHMLHRIKASNMPHELLAKSAKIKAADRQLLAVDATAGLGEDSLILAAAGFEVILYEKNPVIFELLADSLDRAAQIPELADIVRRMRLFNEDSICAMKNLQQAPDVILLDPMFPERQKSSLVKKKLQVLQKLEMPCLNEHELIITAMSAAPKKLIIKRPPKGAYLADMKPDYSLSGKAVRFDCFVSPADRLHKFEKK